MVSERRIAKRRGGQEGRKKAGKKGGKKNVPVGWGLGSAPLPDSWPPPPPWPSRSPHHTRASQRSPSTTFGGKAPLARTLDPVGEASDSVGSSRGRFLGSDLSVGDIKGQAFQ